MILSVLSSRANLIQIMPYPSDTLSNVDSSTVVDLFTKSVINLRLLQTYTLVALSISQ